MYKFLPVDVAPLSNARVRSPVPNCEDDKYPEDNCSNICRFVLVIGSSSLNLFDYKIIE